MKRIAIYPLLLLFALCGCKGKTGTSQAGNVFKPGEIWPDNNGVHINAHGGGMLHVFAKTHLDARSPFALG